MEEEKRLIGNPLIFRAYEEDRLNNRRYEISKDVVCAIMSNPELYHEFFEAHEEGGDFAVYKEICKDAIQIADELLKQLNK